MFVGRFAPSPTGLLHAGNARTALLAACEVLRHKGSLLLRIDDTDVSRSDGNLEILLRQDLSWLGLTFDREVRQSERSAVYCAAVEQLKQRGRLYPCYESAEELEERRQRQRAKGHPSRYDRAARTLSLAQRTVLEKEGRKPHWRFLLRDEVVSWEDQVKGLSSYDVSSLSDPVVVRTDGSYAFLLTGAIDDGAMNVTQVLRGEDHMANTAVQLQMIEAWSGRECVPAYGHISLVRRGTGEVFSKRHGAQGSLSLLREQGFSPAVVRSWLLSVGLSQELPVFDSLEELALHISLSNYGAKQPQVCFDRLSSRQACWFAQKSWEEIGRWLNERGLVSATEDFWLCVRENVMFWEDLLAWYDICFGAIKKVGVAGDLGFWHAALKTLPSAPWTKGTWKQWTHQITEATQKKGKQLFQPLRQALTGKSAGPAMCDLLPLMEREVVVDRLMNMWEEDKACN